MKIRDFEMKKEQKAKQIEKLAEGLKESQAVVFADYSGLTVGEISELRKKLGELGAQFKVVKNTILKLAIAGAKLPLSDPVGPTAVLLSRGGDPLECIKALVSFLKEVGKGEVKFGVFSARGGSALGREVELLDAARVSELALIPSKTVLQGRLVGILNSPLVGFVSVLQGNQRGLVRVLSEVVKQKGGDTA